MPSENSFIEIGLISVIVESILFGIFSVLFALCVYLLLCKKILSGVPRRNFLLALSIMYALAIVHISVNIKRCLQGIIDLYSGKINPLNFLNSDEGALNAIRLVVYLLQSLLADGLMIYRLYVVCGVNFRFLGPVIILFVGNIICGVGTMAGYIEKGSLFQFGTSPLLWLEVFFLITLAINLFGIISITVRIWLTMRRTSGILQSPSFSPLTVTLLDPGMVYSVSLLALFGQYVASSLSFFAALDYEIQIIGIMLSLIVVRVSFRSLWNGQLNISPPQIHVHCIQAQSTARRYSQSTPQRKMDGGSASTETIDVELEAVQQHLSF